jgi:hypothetical protein
MKWRKHGLIFRHDGSLPWARNSCLTPTPFLMGETIRVFSGFRDADGVSRIGYVDVSAADPAKVIGFSREPVLDIGNPGCFDDNGVILGDIVPDGSRIRMYYVGFQKVAKAKFLAYSGLAISEDGGRTFRRIRQTPVLDRADEGLYIRAIHTALQVDGKWQIWYAAGSGWETVSGQPYPRYHIRHMASDDGIHFGETGSVCLDVAGQEYRIGRPRVYRDGGGYQMFFTKGTTAGDYTPGHATSMDGIHWRRDDSRLGISLSQDGWDSLHLCYPSLVHYGNRVWMFYNGNNMGADGFGYAELVGQD